MDTNGLLAKIFPRRAANRAAVALAALVVTVGLSACGNSADPVVSTQGQVAASTATPEVESTTTTEPHDPVTHEFVIPPGTSKRLALRQEVDILPEWLDVRVGDRIQVRNDDVELIRLGIFDVRPGETVSMSFNTVGRSTNVVYSDESGGCGVPPPNAKTFTVNVAP
ncbi:MAG: hypothetical protein WC184_10655 [Acidimicrobiia bacterium]